MHGRYEVLQQPADKGVITEWKERGLDKKGKWFGRVEAGLGTCYQQY